MINELEMKSITKKNKEKKLYITLIRKYERLNQCYGLKSVYSQTCIGLGSWHNNNILTV